MFLSDVEPLFINQYPGSNPTYEWAGLVSPDGHRVNVWRINGNYNIIHGQRGERWLGMDALSAQCVLFELWKRRSWRQRALARIQSLWRGDRPRSCSARADA